jgi:hypothetical protein
MRALPNKILKPFSVDIFSPFSKKTFPNFQFNLIAYGFTFVPSQGSPRSRIQNNGPPQQLDRLFCVAISWNGKVGTMHR